MRVRLRRPPSPNGATSTALGPNANASGVNSVALGAGAIAPASNAVALGANSIASEPNTVSFGSPDSERRVTNVAPGRAASDAATIGQLGDASNAFRSEIVQLESRTNRGLVTANEGVAIALAIGGGAHLEPGQNFALSGNWGTFEGQNGIGVGFRARVNDHVSVQGGFGAGLNSGTTGGSAGISIGW